jgi:cytochrome c2
MLRLSAYAFLLAALALSACDRKAETGAGIGDIKNGAALIARNGCGACHLIPGISGADGRVGPPLNLIGGQTIVAGLLPNTPDNLVTWIRTPQSVVPGNAMPNLELSDHEARDIAAYLYTLR